MFQKTPVCPLHLPGCFCNGSAQQCRAELRTLLLGHLWAEGGQVAHPHPRQKVGWELGDLPWQMLSCHLYRHHIPVAYIIFRRRRKAYKTESQCLVRVAAPICPMAEASVFLGPPDPTFCIPLESPNWPWESPLVIMCRVTMVTCWGKKADGGNEVT